MRKIYKYPLEVQCATIDLHEGYNIVCVHEQNLVPTLWIEFDEGKPPTELRYYVIPTVGVVPEDGKHIGTTFIGSLVWHVYVAL